MTPAIAIPSAQWQLKALLERASDAMLAGHWEQAMRMLESTIGLPPSDLAAEAREILLSLYVSRNEHRRLRGLIRWIDEPTPQMIKGVLLLIRNRKAGIEGELPPNCTVGAIGTAFRQYVSAGAYGADELKTIVSLLTQIDQIELAVQIVRSCLSLDIRFDEATLTRVIALLISTGRRPEALILVGELLKSGPNAGLPLARWNRLLAPERSCEAPGSMVAADKVIKFLELQARDQSNLKSRRRA
jgi:hypothetical protein